MKLLVPGALGLLALIPPLVLLYFLKLRRRRVAVPSLLLWRKVASDPRANTLFERLRRRSLLLLQILILLVLALAAARPYLPLRGLPGRSLVVVIDRSLSMQAVEQDGSTRFETARARAGELIEHLGAGEELLLLAAGSSPEARSGFSADRAELRRALAGIAASDAPADLGAALSTALALTRGRDAAGVLVLSDLAGGRLGPAPPAGNLAFEVLGSRQDNAAITLLAARERAGSTFDREGFVGLRNFGDLPRTVELRIALAGGELRREVVEIGARGSEGRSFALPAGAVGLLEARIGPGDALAADDVAALVIEPPRERRVKVVGPLDPWTERAIRLDRSVRLSPDEPADVTVFVGANPDLPLPGPALLVNPAPRAGGIVGVGPRAESPIVTDYRRDHAVLAWVSLDGIGIGAARALEPGPGALILAETSAGALLVGGEASSGRWLALGLDPLESDLPLRVAWPVLVQNALRWLRAEDTASEAWLAGQSPLVRLPRERRKVSLQGPDGRRLELDAGDGARLRLPVLEQAGIWKLEGAGTIQQLAVNAGSDLASDVAPGTTPAAGERAMAAGAGAEGAEGAPGRVLTGRDAIPLALGLGLLLLLIEWRAWHRRLLG